MKCRGVSVGESALKVNCDMQLERRCPPGCARPLIRACVVLITQRFLANGIAVHNKHADLPEEAGMSYRRKLLLVICAAWPVTTVAAEAAQYPTRPIRLIVAS